jgi:hypothetical protein
MDRRINSSNLGRNSNYQTHHLGKIGTFRKSAQNSLHQRWFGNCDKVTSDQLAAIGCAVWLRVVDRRGPNDLLGVGERQIY